MATKHKKIKILGLWLFLPKLLFALGSDDGEKTSMTMSFSSKESGFLSCRFERIIARSTLPNFLGPQGDVSFLEVRHSEDEIAVETDALGSALSEKFSELVKHVINGETHEEVECSEELKKIANVGVEYFFSKEATTFWRSDIAQKTYKSGRPAEGKLVGVKPDHSVLRALNDKKCSMKYPYSNDEQNTFITLKDLCEKVFIDKYPPSMKAADSSISTLETTTSSDAAVSLPAVIQSF